MMFWRSAGGRTETRFTAARGRNIFERLWERFRSGHDHGLYTTLIEEIAITIDLDKILVTVWESMKNDIDLAFQCDQNHFGGNGILNARPGFALPIRV